MAELINLGRYELRRILGKGAMGVVYEGFDPALSRRVAVKTVLKDPSLDEETARAYELRFVREAKAVARLNHPNIIQVHDFGVEGGIAYLVMEFIEGRELRSFFDAGEHFDAAEAVRITTELLLALEFAHQAGVIHRDVKPANVMLNMQQRVKLADFGVARIQDGDDRSKGGTMVGTPAFMSPEQVSGLRVDHRSDLFSTGIVLYHLLTGERPFKGDGAWTVAKAILQEEPPRPSTLAGKLSPLFDAVVNKALAKKPDHRFSSARQFADALRGALEGSAAAAPATAASEAEVEFWRSIQASNERAEFELYLKKFPDGFYADLARLKLARSQEDATTTPPAAPPKDDPLARLAAETAQLEAELARRDAAFRQREADAEARHQAEARARAVADRQQEAEARARAERDAQERREAIARAQQEAATLLARREAESLARHQAELAKRDTEMAKRNAEAARARARADAEAKSRQAAEANLRQQTEAQAARQRAEAEAAARRETEALARARDEAEARALHEAQARSHRDAQVQQREAEAARREAELQKKLAAGPGASLPVAPLVAAVLAIAGVAGGWYWYASGDSQRVAELSAAFEAAKRATLALDLARRRQEELNQRVTQARLAEDEARSRGDQAQLQELQAQTRRAEAEAQKQAELVRQREAQSKKADAAARIADPGKQAESARIAAEKAAAEKLSLERVAQEKAVADRIAEDKLAAQRTAAKRGALPRAAAPADAEAPLEQLGVPGRVAEAPSAEPEEAQLLAGGRADGSPAIETPAKTEFDGSWRGSATAIGPYECPNGRFEITLRSGNFGGSVEWHGNPGSGYRVASSVIRGAWHEGDSARLRLVPQQSQALAGNFVGEFKDQRLSGRVVSGRCAYELSLKRE